MLAHNASAKALLAIAAKIADRLEEEASHRAHLKFVAWTQSGPAAGLRRQHKLSRVATGWIPNRLQAGTDGDGSGAGDGSDAEQCDDDAARTAETIRDPTAPQSPMGSHREAAEQRGAWEGMGTGN